MSVADEIAKLAELRAAGTLSEEEFEAAKARILGSTPQDVIAQAPQEEPATDQPSSAPGVSFEGGELRTRDKTLNAAEVRTVRVEGTPNYGVAVPLGIMGGLFVAGWVISLVGNAQKVGVVPGGAEALASSIVMGGLCCGLPGVLLLIPAFQYGAPMYTVIVETEYGPIEVHASRNATEVEETRSAIASFIRGR